MSTYKKNIRLGTKDPLWGTDDIADKAITERKLANGAVSFMKFTEDVKKRILEGGSGSGGTVSFTPFFSTGLDVAKDSLGTHLFIPFVSNGQDGIFSREQYDNLVTFMAKNFIIFEQTGVEVNDSNVEIDVDFGSWNIPGATDGKAGVMTAAQVAKLKELEERVLKLEGGTPIYATALAPFASTGGTGSVTISGNGDKSLKVLTAPDKAWCTVTASETQSNVFNVAVTGITGNIGTTEVCKFVISTTDEVSKVEVSVTRNKAVVAVGGYGEWTINGMPTASQNIVAAGGNVTLPSAYATRVVTYDNNYQATEQIAGSWSVSGGATISGSKVVVPANRTTSQKTYTVTYTASGEGSATKTASFNIVQAAAVINNGYVGAAGNLSDLTTTAIESGSAFEVESGSTKSKTTTLADQKHVHWLALKTTAASGYVVKAKDEDNVLLTLSTKVVGEYTVYYTLSNAYIANTTTFMMV